MQGALELVVELLVDLAYAWCVLDGAGFDGDVSVESIEKPMLVYDSHVLDEAVEQAVETTLKVLSVGEDDRQCTAHKSLSHAATRLPQNISTPTSRISTHGKNGRNDGPGSSLVDSLNVLLECLGDHGDVAIEEVVVLAYLERVVVGERIASAISVVATEARSRLRQVSLKLSCHPLCVGGLAAAVEPGCVSIPLTLS